MQRLRPLVSYMVNIRKYNEKDRDSLRKICVETSSFSIKNKKDIDFLYYMYNDYYTRFEKENCFVAVDENDKAVGYILCAENFDSYYNTMKKFYLPKIEMLGRKYTVMAKSEIFLHKLFRKKYPAHLHIDILPPYQGQGAGTELMNTLKLHLKEKNIQGLMLSVGANNKNARKFYFKNGFKQIANIFGSCILIYD